MRDYIKEAAERQKKTSKEKYIYGDILVFVKNELTNNINLDFVLSSIENLIPKDFMLNVDVMYIGDIEEFHHNQRNFNALYKDGAIYVSNEQDNEKDMIDDIIHEIGHAVEEMYEQKIYMDSYIRNEFLGKRKRLYELLKSYEYTVEKKQFFNLNYDEEFDDLLYRKVGYAPLISLTSGLFYSPYAATSLREYFANGFEKFFLNDRNYLKKVSPMLYNKIVSLYEESFTL